MEDYSYKYEIDEMLDLTRSCVKELTGVWMRTFDQDTCRDNLRRLYEHAKNFYDDLVSESLEKKSFIEDEIQTLKSEAEDLQRLLKTNVNLPEVVGDCNVPLLVVQREMDKSLCDLRDQLRRRREQICDLLLEQETLCDELGEPTRPLLADPLPTAEELCHFRNYLDNLKDERDKRMQDLVQLRREIKRDLQILELNVNTEADDRLLNHRQIKLNTETFDSLYKMREHYAEQVEELKTSIENIRRKLPSLWDRLNTPYEERRKIEGCIEYNQTTWDYLSIELERCENLKRQNLQQYIEKIRLEIEIWWDKTLKSELQRNRFSNFNSEIYTDELLTLHEMELEDLKQYFETNQQIFHLYNDRKILWERMAALEQKACDPARYNNRGGQLLREEKERKTIATKLPKIEQQIKELVLEYQEREHSPFFVYGEDILEVMEEDWKKKRENKEALSTARKNAGTPQAYGHSRSHISNSTRTPLMQRTASTVTLCRTPSTNVSKSKRINLASSAQKRKLNPSEKTTPNAKRSLWNSPGGVFLKPRENAASSTKHSSKKAAKPPSVRNKAPRVLATTIRRHSGRLSANGSMKKRRSSIKGAGNIPQIIVTDVFSTDEENYDTFKNCIEPDSRSSIHHESSLMKSSKHKSSNNVSKQVIKKNQQKKKLSTIDEKKQAEHRLATLPKPQIIRTPSKQGLRDFPISPRAVATAGNRKLTTKNLPIII